MIVKIIIGTAIIATLFTIIFCACCIVGSRYEKDNRKENE